MRTTTLEAERLEAWEGLLDGMREAGADPAREAACARLLRHLIDSSERAGWRVRD